MEHIMDAKNLRYAIIIILVIEIKIGNFLLFFDFD